jgi:hypothetical protein
MRRIEELALVKYRDGIWKRRVVEYWLWCDESTGEVCRILKIKRPLLQQWHRWYMRTRFLSSERRCHLSKTPIKSGQRKSSMKRKTKEENVVATSDKERLLAEEIVKLKGALSDALLGAEAMSRLIDVAEKEFKIEIRKKFGAKQLRF